MPRSPVAPISFSKDERTAVAGRIRDFFETELDMPIGALAADRLLKFCEEELGGAFYNRGLRDAEDLLARMVTEYSDALYGLERLSRLG